MSAAELAAAREAAASTALPGTPTENDGGGLSSAAAAPSLTDLLQYLATQNARMESMMEMMKHDRQGGAND